MPPHPVIADEFFPFQRDDERQPLRHEQLRHLVSALARWPDQDRECRAPWLARTRPAVLPPVEYPWPAGPEQTEPDRFGDRMTLAADSEFFVDVPLVVLDRARPQFEQLRDLGSGM